MRRWLCRLLGCRPAMPSQTVRVNLEGSVIGRDGISDLFEQMHGGAK